jgi:hypothetical protein
MSRSVEQSRAHTQWARGSFKRECLVPRANSQRLTEEFFGALDGRVQTKTVDETHLNSGCGAIFSIISQK